MGTESVEGHRALIARAETKIAEETPRVADADEKVEAAKDRLARLARGESVTGGLGKKFDVDAAMKAAGWTPGDFRRSRLLSSLTKAEFESLLEPTRVHQRIDVADKAFEREARRIIRARP